MNIGGSMETRVQAEHEDYSQSANTLFHFMNEFSYLKDILRFQALKPRYCQEDIKYLDLKTGNIQWENILVLQKCFCDIPIGMITKKQHVCVLDNVELGKNDRYKIEAASSHTDFYGEFGIGFSKAWGEMNCLQPVQYINPASELKSRIGLSFYSLYNQEDIEDEFAENFLCSLAYYKPLRGEMKRKYELLSGKKQVIPIVKNFHDEKEWRYVPDKDKLQRCGYQMVIANPNIVNAPDIVQEMNDSISTKKAMLWMPFNYEMVRYIIVPTGKDRMDLIEFICELPDQNFVDENYKIKEKMLLISKILVLDELRKDT